MKKENLWDELTPTELEFVKNPENERIQINLSWKSEALVALLWSLNKFQNIPKLDNSVNFDDLKMFSVLPPNSTGEYIKTAKLRSEDEIENEHELVYDSHWIVRDTQINKKPILSKKINRTKKLGVENSEPVFHIHTTSCVPSIYTWFRNDNFSCTSKILLCLSK